MTSQALYLRYHCICDIIVYMRSHSNQFVVKSHKLVIILALGLHARHRMLVTSILYLACSPHARIITITYCTFDLLCIKNIPVVLVSGFIRLSYWYHTAGKVVWSNLSGCTIAFLVSKMKPLKAYLMRYTCTGQFLTRQKRLCFTVPPMPDSRRGHTCMYLFWSKFWASLWF